MNTFKTVIITLLILNNIMAQDITSVKINELATSAISSSDYFVKADANGIAYKNTLSALASFIGSVGVSGYRGALAIADTPTEDGFYFASESGTYTNAGGLVVDLDQGINIISVEDGQTMFELVVIPVDLSNYAEKTELRNNVFKQLITDPRADVYDVILYGFNATRDYRLSRLNNSFMDPNYQLLIEIKDDTDTVVARFFQQTTDDIRKNGLEWVYLSSLNDSGVTGYILIDWSSFRDEGQTTFNYEFTEQIKAREEVELESRYLGNKWLVNKGQRFLNFRIGEYYRDVIDAITDVIIPPPDLDHVRDEIVIESFQNDNNGSYLFQLKNLQTGEAMDINPTLAERTEGIIIRELTFTGFKGNFATFYIDYASLTRTGLLISSARNNNSISLKIQSASANPWNGKKIVWLGTSIPENQNGDGATLSDKLERSYPSLVARMLGANMLNHSRAGLASALAPDGTIKQFGSLSATLAEYGDINVNPLQVNPSGGDLGRNIYRAYENAMLGQDADLYVFDLVPNNTEFDTTEWDKFDFNTLTFSDDSTFAENRTTYLGSVLYLYNELMNENKLHRVVFVTEYINDHPGVLNTDIASEVLSIPHIKLREKLGCDTGWFTTQYILDTIHPSQYATYRLAGILYGELLKVN